MAILPVSNIGVRSNYNTSFGKRNVTKPDEQPVQVPNRHKNMSTIPVVVLMTLSPSMCKGDNAGMYIPINEANVIEAAIPAKAQEASPAKTYVMGEDNVKDKDPFGWHYFTQKTIDHSLPATVNGEKYNIVLCHDVLEDGVGTAFIVKEGTSRYSVDKPPQIREFVYHDIGEKDEFCGVIVDEDISDNHGEYLGFDRYELKLDNESAQYLMYFFTNHTNYKNVTNIKCSTTNSAELSPLEKKRL